jgi:hypothetical protein
MRFITFVLATLAAALVISGLAPMVARMEGPPCAAQVNGVATPTNLRIIPAVPKGVSGGSNARVESNRITPVQPAGTTAKTASGGQPCPARTTAEVAGTEGPNDFFTYQTRTRESCASSEGTNCIIQIADCLNTAPEDRGACSLRNDQQIIALTKSVRSSQGWFYDPAKDAAKVVIEAGDTDVVTGDHLHLSFPPTPPTDGPTSVTVIWDTWWDTRWLHDDCPGGGLGTGQINLKTWRLDRVAADPVFPNGVGAIAGNPKLTFQYVAASNRALFPCSSLIIGHVAGGLTSTAEYVDAYAKVAPIAVGHDKNSGDSWVIPSGNGGVYQAGWKAGQGYLAGVQRAGGWTRYIYHTEWNIPGNSSKFRRWREDCDPAGVNTARDQVCARMLQTLAAVDPNCGVEDAPNCSSRWSAISLWTCTEVSGCRRIYYMVPWHDFGHGAGITRWRIEYDSSQASSPGSTDRLAYERNNMIIRNIAPTDIDDTGCPLNCLGDKGAVSRNVFRKPLASNQSQPAPPGQ